LSERKLGSDNSAAKEEEVVRKKARYGQLRIKGITSCPNELQILTTQHQKSKPLSESEQGFDNITTPPTQTLPKPQLPVHF
jgi:hypothetical protein